MTIIDAQVHVWKADTPERPHLKEDASKPHRSIPLTYDALLGEMKAAGVDRAVLVPPSCYRQAVTLFTQELDFLSLSDKEWIMGRALSNWLNWPTPEQGEPGQQKQSS